MSIDVVSKFLSVSGDRPPAQNDNPVALFTASEKAYIADLAGKYGLASRTYTENDGERIDIFMNRMEQQYNLPTIRLIKEPDVGNPYKVVAGGHYGFVIPSNDFSPMQSALTRVLMTHFQKQKLRSFDA